LVLPEGVQVNQGTEDSWAVPHYLYPPDVGQIRDVVQGFGQGFS
jgi:hypothetical protein